MILALPNSLTPDEKYTWVMKEIVGISERVLETEHADKHFSTILKLSSNRFAKYCSFYSDGLSLCISFKELVKSVVKNSVIIGDSDDIMQFSIKVNKLECTPKVSLSFLIIKNAIIFFLGSLFYDCSLNMSVKLYFESYLAINNSFLVISYTIDSFGDFT